jgi:hypothetical protein
MTQYQVVGAIAHVKTMTQSGPKVITLYKGAMVPADAPADRIRHLLSVKLIAPVGGAASTSAPTPPASANDGGDGLSEERKTAQAKLPADGSMPHHNAGQPVWVEYLVTKGYDYNALKDQEKPALIDLAKNAA